MNIAVCLKQVPDTSVGIAVDPLRPTGIEENGLVYVVNPCDRAALEASLFLKDTQDGRVTAVSVGPVRSEAVLRVALSTGVDRVLRIWDEVIDDCDIALLGHVLHAALTPLAPDLIICGARSSDHSSGLVPAALAESMRIALIDRVTALDLIGAKSINVQRALEKGDREILNCRLPLVLAVEASAFELRYAALPALLDAMTVDIEHKTLDDLGVPRHIVSRPLTSRLLSLCPSRPRPKRIFTPDSSLSPDERLKMLLSGGIVQKKGNLIEAAPEEAARQLVQFLIKERVV